MTPPTLRCGLTGVMLVLSLTACSKEARSNQSLEKAAEYRDSGDFEAAAIEYKNALEADSGNVEAAKQLGMLRLDQGSSYEAARYLSYASQQKPEDSEVALAFARALLNLGFPVDARRNLLGVLDRDPNHGEALIALAESSLTPEWTDETRAKLEAADADATEVILSKALLELRAGAIESGASLVGKALEQAPDSPEAHGLQAGILKVRGQLDASLAELRKAAELAGPRSAKQLQLAKELADRGQSDEALEMLRSLNEGEPDYLPAQLELAQLLASRENFKAAGKRLEQLLATDPYNVQAAILQGDLLMREGKNDKAALVLDRVADAFPGRPPLEIARAKVAIKAGDLSKAAALLDPFINPERGVPDAMLLRARIHLQLNEGAEAVSLLEPLRNNDRENTEVLELLIQAHRQAGNLEAEQELLKTKSESDDGTPDTRLQLAGALIRDGKTGEAETLLEELQAQHPDFFPAVALTTELLLQEERREEATELVNQYAESHPDSAEAQSLIATLALAAGDQAGALEALGEAVDLDPTNRKAHKAFAQLSSTQGNQEAALAAYDGYLAAFPDDPTMALQRALVLMGLDRNDDAHQALITLTEEHPDYAHGFNNLAEFESSILDQPEMAHPRALKAQELAPEEPAIADTLGWIEWKLGNYPTALALLREAAEGIPQNRETWFRLGRASQSMGRIDEAIESFSRAIEGPSEAFAQGDETRREIEKLRSLASASTSELEKQAEADPADLCTLLALADRRASEGEAEAARDLFRQAIDRNPELVAAWAGLAELYLGPLDDPEEASKAATKARELDPRDPRVLGVVGLSLLATGDEAKAYAQLKDALIGRPSPLLRSGFARAAYRLGRVDEAREAMQQVADSADESLAGDAQRFLLLSSPEPAPSAEINPAIEAELARHPQSLSARFALARQQINDGAAEEASQGLEALLVEFPEFDPARLALIPLYASDEENLTRALELARDARSRRPDDDALAAQLASLHFRLEEFPQATRLLEALARKAPLGPEQSFMLGISQWKNGQTDRARESLTQSLELNLPSDQQAEARQALEQIEALEEEQE